MNSLKRPEGFQNMSGLLQLAVVDKNDIHSMVCVDGYARINLKPFKDWTSIYFTPGTAGYAETSAETDHGQQYSYAVECFYPTDTPELRAMLRYILSRQLVVALTDVHHIMRVAGTNLYGLKASRSSVIEQSYEGRRGTVLQITGVLPFESFLLQR